MKTLVDIDVGRDRDMDTECVWDSILDVDALEELLESLYIPKGNNVEQFLNDIYQGKQIFSIAYLKEITTGVIVSEWSDLKSVFVMILIIMIVASVLQNIGEIFAKNGIREIAEYVMLVFLNTVLMKGYMQSEMIVSDAAEELMTFIKLLIPAYFVAIGSTNGMVTVSGFYQFVLLVIGILEQLVIAVIIPAVNVFVMVLFMDAILGGEHLKNISMLLEKAVLLGLKAAMSIVIGFGAIQSIITPVIGSVNRNLLEKTISVIPGVGDISESVTSVLTGSAVLIKNTIGVFGMIILVMICGVPICKVGLIGGSIKLAGALGSVLGKSRLVQCTNRIGDGCFLMAKVMFTIGALFFIMIAMIAFSTNRGI